jgi:hypothetical protein
MGTVQLLPAEITPPKDLKVSQEMRDSLIIAQRMINEGKTGLVNKWQLLAKGCALVLDKHLYLAAGYTNYKDYFIKIDLDPSYVVRMVNALRLFGDSSLTRLPWRRLLQLVSLPSEVIAEIKKNGVEEFIGLAKKGKDFTARVEDLKAKAASHADSARVKTSPRKRADDLYSRLRSDDKEDRKAKVLQAKAFVENDSTTQELESQVIQLAANLDSLLHLTRRIGEKQLEFAMDDGIAKRVQEMCGIIYSAHQHGAAAVEHLKTLIDNIEETIKRDGEQGGRDIGLFLKEFSKYFQECRRVSGRFESLIEKASEKNAGVASGNVVPLRRPKTA